MMETPCEAIEKQEILEIEIIYKISSILKPVKLNNLFLSIFLDTKEYKCCFVDFSSSKDRVQFACLVARKQLNFHSI